MKVLFNLFSAAQFDSTFSWVIDLCMLFVVLQNQELTNLISALNVFSSIACSLRCFGYLAG